MSSTAELLVGAERFGHACLKRDHIHVHAPQRAIRQIKGVRQRIGMGLQRGNIRILGGDDGGTVGLDHG